MRMPTRIHVLLSVCVLCTALGLGAAGFAVLTLRRATATQAACSAMIKECSDGLACLRETGQ